MAKRKVRIRAKRRLDELDETKLSLAVYLIARDLVTDETSPQEPSENDSNGDVAGEAA